MIDMNRVSQTVADALKDETHGDFKVAVRTDYETNGQGESRIIGGKSPIETATIFFDVVNPAIETDTVTDKYLNTRLASVAAFAPYVDFNDEKPKDGWKDQAALFDELQPLTATLIPAQYKDWFQEKVTQSAAGKTESSWEPHAFNVSRDDTKISARLTIGEGVNVDQIEKMIEAKKADILKFIEQYIDRKHPGLAGKAKNLDMVVETQSYGDNWKHVNITFRSKEVIDAMKLPGGLEALPAEKHQELKATNALMALRDGDGKTKENPAELQKVIARAVFQTIPEVTAKTAKTLDMVAAISKPLKKLQAQPGTSPEVVAKIDTFLNHELFKDPEQIQKLTEKGIFQKQKLIFDKVAGNTAHYTPGLMTVAVTVPKDKMAEVLAQIADPHLAPAAQAPTPETIAADGINAIAAGAAAAGAIAVCEKNEIAVAGAGAATDGHTTGAVAGAACIPKEPEQASIAHMAASSDTPVANIGGTTITKGNLQSFLSKAGGSHADRAKAGNKPVQLGA